MLFCYIVKLKLQMLLCKLAAKKVVFFVFYVMIFFSVSVSCDNDNDNALVHSCLAIVCQQY